MNENNNQNRAGAEIKSLGVAVRVFLLMYGVVILLFTMSIAALVNIVIQYFKVGNFWIGIASIPSILVMLYYSYSSFNYGMNLYEKNRALQKALKNEKSNPK